MRADDAGARCAEHRVHRSGLDGRDVHQQRIIAHMRADFTNHALGVFDGYGDHHDIGSSSGFRPH
jgi:hypothetical protein